STQEQAQQHRSLLTSRKMVELFPLRLSLTLDLDPRPVLPNHRLQRKQIVPNPLLVEMVSLKKRSAIGVLQRENLVSVLQEPRCELLRTHKHRKARYARALEIEAARKPVLPFLGDPATLVEHTNREVI